MRIGVPADAPRGILLALVALLPPLMHLLRLPATAGATSIEWRPWLESVYE
ncbi:hypothetical protein ACFIOY_02020 [Bradyrhizobium sp. TZ2]